MFFFIKQNKLILILLALGIILTIAHGFNIGIIVEKYDDYLDRGIIDGFTGTTTVLIPNLAFIFLSAIFAIIKLCTKPHDIAKTITSIVLLLFIVFIVPAYSVHRSGGIDGRNVYEDRNILYLLLEAPHNQS